MARRLPAAQRFIVEHGLNERLGPADGDLGIIVQGGLFNVLNGRLALAGLSDVDGNVALPTLGAERRASAGARGDRRLLRRQAGRAGGRGGRARLHRAGDRPDPAQGRHADQAARQGRAADGGRVYAARGRQGPAPSSAPATATPTPALERMDRQGRGAAGRGRQRRWARPCRARPPTFCTGCPERPGVLGHEAAAREIGQVHVSADIGCHAFATFAPFSQGNSILGYGMSLASAAAVSGTQTKRPISVMGDGGFWHNGLLTGVAGAVFNKDDSRAGDHEQRLLQRHRPAGHPLQQGGAGRPRQGPRHRGDAQEHGRAVDQRVRTYGVAGVRRHPARGACAPAQKGLKVIIADGECQLARQRRIRPEIAAQRQRPASAWCARASGSTRRCAPAIIPASACRAARR